jgi:hypothetical protein
MDLPDQLVIDAFTGDGHEVSGRLAEDARYWGGNGQELARQAPLAPAGPANPADWSHEDIGWGVVMADRDDVTPRDKSRGVDAPPAIRRLLAARNDAPLLRYRPDHGLRQLVRYLPSGGSETPEIGQTGFGSAAGRLPLYLLIVGSPAEVPWRLQYAMSRRHCVGRLDLPPQGLENYVGALLNDWRGVTCDPTRPVVWSTRSDSITQKMAAMIADWVAAAMAGDTEISVARIDGDCATHSALLEALSDSSPAVVVTCSHGKTGPLDDAGSMRASLGLPVDADRETLDIDALLAGWSPAGAIWLAQACCSAGSDDGSSFVGLVAEGSAADRVLRAVGGLGAAQAPLPTRLLGADEPLRAFIGHVEPTFDWTLQVLGGRQALTKPLVDFIYPSLYRRCPIGLSLRGHHRAVNELYGKLEDARSRISELAEGAREEATYFRLTARDRQSMVTLGDPLVAMQPLPSQMSDVLLPDCAPGL